MILAATNGEQDIYGWVDDFFYVGAMLDSGSRPYNYISAAFARKMRDAGSVFYKEKIKGKLIDGSIFTCEEKVMFQYQINKHTTINMTAYVLENLPVELLIGKSTMDNYNLNEFLTPVDEALIALGLADSFAAMAVDDEEVSDNDVFIREAYPLIDTEEEVRAGTATTMRDGYSYEENFYRVFDDKDKSGAQGLPPFDLQRKESIQKDFYPKVMRLPPRRFTADEQRAVDKATTELEAAGIIERVSLQEHVEGWSQIHLVRKSDGQYRFCCDYRALNSMTRGQHFPLPRIGELIDSLAGYKYFTKLDLSQAYHQISLSAEASILSTFITINGLWKWKKLPFGMAGAPSAFQTLMSTKILQGLTYGENAVCRVYLDDIVVVGKNKEELRKNTEIVLRRLEDYNIKLSLKKCSFEVEEIEYLGTIVNAEGRSASPKSRKAMEDIVKPTTVTTLRSFLGLGQYVAQYIPHYANWAAPMHAAAAARSKQAKIVWTAEMERGFEKIKAELREERHLAFLREEGQLILYTDASDYAIGACLMQVQDGVERPLMFISKSLTKVQRRWSTSDKEMLAIVWAVEKCRFYIGGSSCLVRTDHKALPYSERVSSSKKIERWKLALQEYNLTFEYWKGSDNLNADAMSRVTTELPGDEPR